MKEKKDVKKKLREGDKKAIEKLKILKEQIVKEENESYFRRLKKTSEEINQNGKFSSGGFWKVKKRIERKKEETPHAVINKDGKLVTQHVEIREAYQEYFKNLLTTTNEKTKMKENEEILKKVEQKFQEICERAKEQEPKKTKESVIEAVIKNLKRKKARDSAGWNNEMVIDGGKEMKESMRKMADAVKRMEKVPMQWQQMLIKSTHKKGQMEDLANKRGLFLTNIISKVFEKVIDTENPVKFDRSQSGGTKKRGTVDNWMMVNAVIDEGKRLGKLVYLFFADLVKCFDRLWLKDCLNDLHECGMREKEIMILYKLNKEAKFKVLTPVGETDEVTVNEVVKQGTVYGPKLCGASTGKVNDGLEIEEIIYPEVKLQAITFVDDINSTGGRDVVEAVMKNCAEKEKEKMWEFSTEKTKWMCQRNRKRNVENLEVKVMQGMIEKDEVYKYLGNMLNEKGNMDDQLELMERKAKGVIKSTNTICHWTKIGQHEIEGKKLLYRQQIVPAVFYNIETWTNFRKSDVKKMEKIQAKILKEINGMPKSTPYWGLINELNEVPIILLITYKRLMLYHNIMNSDEDRPAKKIVKYQEKSGHEKCWFGNLKKEGEDIGIEVTEERAKRMMKSEWKKEVKEKIERIVKKKTEEAKRSSRKMRFIKEGSGKYLSGGEVFGEDAKMAMKIRLNMVTWISDNVGGDDVCPLCEKAADTTEHVFECPSSLKEATITNLEEGKQMKKIVDLFRRNEDMRRTVLKDDIRINMERLYVVN